MENPSKLLDSLFIFASLFQHTVVPTRTRALQSLTCHIVDFLHASPYLGHETETSIKDMVRSESDEESMRNPYDVSISLRAYSSKYRVPNHSNIMKEMTLMSALIAS